MSTARTLLRELKHRSIRVEDLLASNARLTTEIEELKAWGIANGNWISGWLNASDAKDWFRSMSEEGKQTLAKEAWDKFIASEYDCQRKLLIKERE